MNWRSTIIRLLVWTMFAAAQTWSLIILTHSILGAFVFALCYVAVFVLITMTLQSVVKYGNFDKYPELQRFTSYFGLSVLVVISAVGISFGAAFLVCGEEILEAFTSVLPVEIFITVLVFFLLLYHYKNKEKETAEVQQEQILKDANRETIEQIAIKTGQKLNVISINEIYYLQADGDYVKIFTENKRFMKEQTMKYFDERLPSDRFLRIHRSYIVNTQKITRIEQYGKQSMILTLHNSEKLKVSAAGYKLLKARLGI